MVVSHVQVAICCRRYIPNIDDARCVLVVLLGLLQLLANLLHVRHGGELLQGDTIILRVVLVFAALESSKKGSSLVILLGLNLLFRFVGDNLLGSSGLGLCLALGL